MGAAAAPGEARAPRRLPPRPRRRAWLAGGLCAGLLLGQAEVGALHLSGSPLPPRLALTLVFGSALLVALPAGAVGVMLALRGARASHSALVGALLGPVLLAPAFGGGLALVAGRAARPLETALRLAAMLLLAAAASRIAARAGERVEAGGSFLSGPLVWGAVALLIALGETVAARGLEPVWIAGLGAALFGVGLAVAGLQAWLDRRGRPPWSWRALLSFVLATGVGVALAPRALPWLLLGPDLPPVANGPPNVVLARMGSLAAPSKEPAPDPAGAHFPNLALLATEAISYEAVGGLTQATGGWPLLETSGGGSVLASLTAQGFATAVLLTDPAAAAPLGAGEIDARPGAAGLLQQRGVHTAAGALLVAAGSGLATALGLGAALRPPAELTADALSWLLRWRTTRAGAPFFLAVDYSRPAGADEAAGEPDAGLGRLLDRLRDLDVDRDTCVMVESAAAASSLGAGEPRGQLVFRPPPRAESMPRGVRVQRPVMASDIARALLVLPQVEGASAIPLPGLDATGREIPSPLDTPGARP